jgi:hydrogenase/urease accessory protein HupE
MRQGLTLAAALALVPTAAFAHPGIGEMHGFTHGFAHPLGGLDHMLAMVTVGIFAWQLGGRALWLVPAAFVAAMALGGTLAMTGVPVPMVETGIAASVIVLGATVALGIKAPVAIAMGLVGLFAIFHGHAHGSEMPPTPAPTPMPPLAHAGDCSFIWAASRSAPRSFNARPTARGSPARRRTGALAGVA